MTAVVQVQKDAPVKLLLGTDLQPSLGFSLIQSNGSVAVDLLQKGEWTRKKATNPIPKVNPSPPADPVGDQVVPTHTVRLLQATRIPPQEIGADESGWRQRCSTVAV